MIRNDSDTPAAPAATLPSRFQLTDREVAAVLALAGLEREPGSPLPELPAPADPRAALHGSRALDPSGAVRADVVAGLRAAASPESALSLAFNRAGSPGWSVTTIVRGAGSGAFTAVARRDEGTDFAFLPQEIHVLLLLDEVGGFTDLPSAAGERPHTLKLPGFAALLAAADHRLSEGLRRRLARDTAVPPVWLDTAALEAQLSTGLEHSDTRWAVSAAQYACPAALAHARGKLAEGARELCDAGLLAPAAGGYRVTPAGEGLTSALGQIVTTLALGRSGSSARLRTPSGHATFFRTTFTIIGCLWGHNEAGIPEVELQLVSAEDVFHLLTRLLAPLPHPTTPEHVAAPAPEPACALCGAGVPAGAAFCPRCGASAAAHSQPAHCPSCGTVVAMAGARYCAACGHSL